MAGRQTAITEHKYHRGQSCHRNGWLFRGISSSSSILVSCTLSHSFIAGFLIDDKAVYVSLMSPLYFPPPPVIPHCHALILILVYASSFISFLFFSFLALYFISLCLILSLLISHLFLLSSLSFFALFTLRFQQFFSSSSSLLLLLLHLSPSYIICSMSTPLFLHLFYFNLFPRVTFCTSFFCTFPHNLPHIFFLSFYFSTFIFSKARAAHRLGP